jgi:hypothetical protein
MHLSLLLNCVKDTSEEFSHAFSGEVYDFYSVSPECFANNVAFAAK